MVKSNADMTFIFEYISLEDAHVVCYSKEQEGLYLIGIRSTLTGEQLRYHDVIDIANCCGVKSTKLFNKTLHEVLYDVKNCKSNEKEGFVISIDERLVKIKVDDYVGIHKVLSKISSINLIIKHIADGQFDDLIAKVPQAYQNRIMKIAKIVFNYILEMEYEVNRIYSLAPKSDKKEFILWCNENIEKKYIGYVRAKYLGNDLNFLKSGNQKSPSYKKLNEITGDNNYNDLFCEG